MVIAYNPGSLGLGFGSGTLGVAGTVTWTNGSIVASNGAVWHDQAGSTFDVQSGAGGFSPGDSSAPVFNNAGTFALESGSLVFGIAFNNTGTVDVQAGSLILTDGGLSSGKFTEESGGTLNFYGGTYTLQASATISGAGMSYVGDSGDLNIAGAPTIANLTLGNPYLVSQNPALEGAGTLTVSGTMDWNYGDIDTAKVQINGSMVIVGNPPGLGFGSGTLDVAGTATWDGGDIVASNGAVWNDQAGSTFDVQSGAGKFSLGDSSAPAFNNAGTFTVASGSAFFDNVAFNNTGTVNLKGKAEGLTVNGTYTQTAGSTILQDGTLSSNGTVNIQGGSLTGPGWIYGNLTNAGQLDPGGDSPGILYITGNYTQTKSGTLSVNVAGPDPGTEYDQLIITGSATVDGTLSISAVNEFDPNESETFPIMTFKSSSGKFATINGLGSGPFAAFQAVYDPTNLTLEVNPKATKTTVSSSPTPSYYGQAVTFTATVTPLTPGAGTPTGTVTFEDGGNDLGPGNVTTGNGVLTATFTTSASAPLAAGTHSITAVYSGDANFVTSPLNPDVVTVLQASTATTLSSSSSGNTSVYGQPLTFTAMVSAVVPGAGTPTGTVEFMDGDTDLGPGTQTTANGVITATYQPLASAPLAVGSHAITADYSGDDNFLTSTANVTQTVKQAGTSTVVSSDSVVTNPVYGQAVTFTATVSATAPGAGSPTGSVQFMINGNDEGGPQALTAGHASLPIDDLDAGTDIVTAQYEGDANFLGSPSNNFSQTVSPASTSTAVTSVPSSSVFGQAVIFTATVSVPPPGAGTPTGSVMFTDGKNGLGTFPLITANGVSTASFSISTLAVGPHTITAAYLPDNADFSSGTSGSLNFTVSQDKTVTTIGATANPAPPVYGEAVSLTAAITVQSPGAGTPTGKVTFMDGGTPLMTSNPSTLSVGVHTITGAYGGDANDFPSTSLPLTLVIGKDVTTTTVTASLTSEVFGLAETLTATVAVATPGTGPATGTVTFKDGTTVLGTGNLSTANGVTTATYKTMTPFSTGTHPITVVYSGDNNDLTSTSSPLNLVVNPDATTTTVAASVNPATFGQAVTLTATVAVTNPGTATPTGMVTFKDGTTVLGTGVVSTSNSVTTATFKTPTTLTVGTHPITAVYSGDIDDLTSTSAPVSLVVKNATSTTVATATNPAAFGQAVTLTATVAVASPGTGTPTGTVNFMDGNTVLGTGTLSTANSVTTATYKTPVTLAVASHAITAVYLGDTNNLTSTSATLSLVIKNATTTTLVASANSAVIGQPVTLTATIAITSPGTGTPTGTVTFMDGATVLGTGTLSTTNSVTTAMFTTLPTFAAGTHAITALYGGDTNDLTSTSAALSLVVNNPTTTTLVASANSAAFGQPVTLTATIAGSGTSTPIGTVTFKDGTTVLGTGTLSTTNGVTSATFQTATLAVATHAITAVYGGDINDLTSTSAPLSLVVNQDATTTTVAGAANPAVFGQAVTLTATVAVTSPGAGTPTGMVTFMDGTTVLGTGTLSTAAGVTTASFQTVRTLAVATHTITAVYGGDTNDLTSTSMPPLNLVVKNPTTTTLVASANAVTFGQAVTLTATVMISAPGTGTPTGMVTFMDGNTVLGTGTLSTAGGITSATFLTRLTLAVGTHSITAVYRGDTNDLPSISVPPLNLVVKNATTTSLVAQANSVVFGQSATLTATVLVLSPGAGTPTGTVMFMDGTTTLGTGTLSTANGVTTATFQTPLTLAVATHSITAIYSGDTNDLASPSAPVSLVVNQDATNTTVAASVNPAVLGQPVTLTATVAVKSPGAGTPTGTVTVKDGTTVLGTATVNTVNGVTTATFQTPPIFAVATHLITAIYSGDTNDLTSSSATLSLVVNQQATTTTTVTASANPTVFGQAVTLTATVTNSGAGAPTPTGTVTFKDGTTVLGPGTLSTANGVTTANFQTATLAVATHAITAVYGGDTNDRTITSAPVSLVVNKDATTTTLAASANPAAFGQAVTLTATVAVTSPGAGTPTGTVRFMDGTSFLGLGPLSTANGITTASFQTPLTLAVATHAITAVYGGDPNPNELPSTSAPVSLVVNKDATTTTLAASANPAAFGQAVTLTATVAVTSPGAGTPTGMVTFMDGTNALGTGTLSSVSGIATATFNTSTLGVATHAITAVYGGDTNDLTSTSAPVSLVVNQNTTTTVAAWPNPLVFGQPVILTATVAGTSPGGGSPTGTVTFKDGTTTLGTGTRWPPALAASRPQPSRLRRSPPIPMRSRRSTAVTSTTLPAARRP